MNSLRKEDLKTETFLDCSQDEDVRFFAARFNVSPQVVRSAVCAYRSNSVERLAHYLQNSYLPIKGRGLN
jgi:hypothetical protein